MRPRSTENRDLPPGVYRRKRTSKSTKNPTKAWISYFYRDKDGTYRSGVEDWEKSCLVEYFRDGVQFRRANWDSVLENYKNS